MTTRLLPHRTTHNQSAFRWSFVNQNLGDQIGQSEERKIPLTANENSKENRLNCLKCGKTRDLVYEWFGLLLHLIGRESGASFLDQSQSKVQSREWRKFSGTITEQSTAKIKQSRVTFNTRLKIAISPRVTFLRNATLHLKLNLPTSSS